MVVSVFSLPHWTQYREIKHKNTEIQKKKKKKKRDFVGAKTIMGVLSKQVFAENDTKGKNIGESESFSILF